MKLERKFDITKSEYIDIYRIHVKYKFKLQKYMLASVLLFAFGMVMQFIGVDLKFANILVGIVMAAAILLNLVADFIFPSTAYKNLLLNEKNKGRFILEDDHLTLIYGKVKSKRAWSDYDACLETNIEFLLYRKNEFDVLLKSTISDHTDEVRSLLNHHVNKGKTYIIKR